MNLPAKGKTGGLLKVPVQVEAARHISALACLAKPLGQGRANEDPIADPQIAAQWLDPPETERDSSVSD